MQPTKPSLPKTAISIPVLQKLLSANELDELTKKYTRYFGNGGRGRTKGSKWLTLPVTDDEIAIFKEWRDGNISITEARRKLGAIYNIKNDKGTSYKTTLRLLATATSLTQ